MGLLPISLGGRTRTASAHYTQVYPPQGRCGNGAECTFAHGAAELRRRDAGGQMGAGAAAAAAAATAPAPGPVAYFKFGSELGAGWPVPAGSLHISARSLAGAQKR